MQTKVSLVSDLFSFLKKPKYTDSFEQKNFGEKLWMIIRVWSLQFMIVVVLGLITSTILKSTDYQGKNLVEEAALDYPIWLFFFLACVQAPLLEETIFRVWFRVTPFNLSIGLSLIFNLIINLLLEELKYLKGLQNWISSLPFISEIAISLIIIYFLFVSTYFFFLKNPKIFTTFKSFVQNNFKTFFYFSATVFGIAHISNNTELSSIWFAVPLLALPQFIGGLGLGYIRSKLGALWSILTHAINNFVPFSVFLLISFLSSTAKEAYLNGEMTRDMQEKLGANDARILLLIGVFGLLFFAFNVGVNMFNLVEYLSLRKQGEK